MTMLELDLPSADHVVGLSAHESVDCYLIGGTKERYESQ